MTLIKILLLAGIVAFALLAFRGSRKAIHQLLWRVYIVVVVMGAGMSVVFPDALTRVAQLLGVGRGADLLLYVSVVTFMLISVVLFRRIGTLERRYAELARQLAVERPILPESKGARERRT